MKLIYQSDLITDHIVNFDISTTIANKERKGVTNMRGDEGEYLERNVERQTLFMTYNNCLFSSDSFDFFSDMLAYRSLVSTC